jgi:hypothetical protein
MFNQPKNQILSMVFNPSILGAHFEDVKKFVYIGSLMTSTNDMSLKTQQRIQTANRCFSKCTNICG